MKPEQETNETVKVGIKKTVSNQVTVPVFELDENGIIKPNPLFHRPLDHLHSRCIECPYCASKLNEGDHRILDIGTAKADAAWIAWLGQIPAQVHALDYDLPEEKLSKSIHFVCADVRATPYPDNYFDVVMAASVIEHIGLIDPQVMKGLKPRVDENGDFEAVKEITRILKPGGRLLMTVPFGEKAGLILNKQARSYDLHTIKKFDSVIQPYELEVFEYSQGVSLRHSSMKQKMKRSLGGALLSSLSILGINLHLTGLVTWRKSPPDKCKARNRWHVDAVACGVWVKRTRAAVDRK